MKNIFKYLGILLVSLFILNTNVLADSKVNIDLDNLKIDNKSIKEYDNLEDFIKDYNNDNLDDVYITNFLFDGVSSVKSPDLDDFIENNSNDTKIKNLDIKVLNINNIGNYELSGKFVGMIAVNTNELKGDINLYLNNVSIDTDTKKAPAIYVYNKDINYTDCKVTIYSVSNSKNYIEGGKLKKVSLVGSDELDKYSSNYMGDMKNNYGIYTSYYGIYTNNQIDNILFAKVTANKEDLQDGDPYYFYKASGSISSDIDLYFAGDGYLNVTSKNKEGIETKGNLYLGDGKGDYVINAMDDCINTTTSFQAENVRNDLVINVNTLYANVLDDADEGDAIDSNGILTINAGTIYAFAHYKSGDSGLDSDKGTYINGGTIIATGNMDDRIDSSSQKTIYVTFNETIPANTLLVIKDENDKIITAFKTNKDIKTLLYTTKDLSYNSYKIYKDGVITGDSENGLYYSIDSYTDGTLVSYSNSDNFINNSNNKEDISNKLLNVLLVEISALVLILLYVFISKKREDNNKLSS